jgi:invasion protein IalB
MMRLSFSFVCSFLALFFLFGTVAQPAYAKAKQPSKQSAAKGGVAQPKADWQVGMIKGDKDKFNYCLMKAEFNNDLSLAIALSGKQEVNIGIGVPKAGFGKEDKHPMTVKIDDLYTRNAVALAAEPELLIVPMGADKKMFDALRRGKTITLTGPEDRSVFALKNTAKAFQQLQLCVDVGTGKIKPEQIAAQQQAAQKQAQAQPARKLKPGEFPPSLKGLLVKSGLKKLELVTIKDPSKAPVDFAWRTEGVFGGMRERPVPKEATIEKMSEILEGGYKKQCDGMFNAKLGDIETYSGIKIRKADIACQMKEHNAYVALFFYLTDTGLFTMFMHEGEKGIANSARDGIAATIRQMAKNLPPASAEKK